MWEKNYFKIITLSEERLQCMREIYYIIAKSMKNEYIYIIDRINKK